VKIPWRVGPPRVLAFIRGPKEKTVEVSAVLDTGSYIVLIKPKVAKFLGYDLEKAQETILYSVSGMFNARKLVLEEVSVGDCEAKNVDAVCFELPSARIGALLGLNWINRFRITFDKGNEEILIE